MNKFVSFIALTFALMGSAIATERQERRYYVGIGMEPWQVSKSTVAFYKADGDQHIRLENTNGRFTGKVFVARVLSNSPAAVAGMEQDDMILKVDGEDISTLGEQGVIDRIRNGAVGDVVRFTLGKLSNDGEVARTVEVDIPRAMIDEVAWLYKDLWLMSGAGSGHEMVYAEYMLTEDATTGEFTYHYRLRSKMDKKVHVQWDSLNAVFFATKILVPLEPGEVRDFTLTTKHLPATDSRTVCVYADHEWLLDHFTKDSEMTRDYRLGIDRNKSLLLNNLCFGADAFVPRNLIEREEDLNK